MEIKQNYRYKVCTRCATYNHALFIEDALNGFAIQETTFPVVYVIVDDASTDGEQVVIKRWASKMLVQKVGNELWKEMSYGQLAVAQLKGNPNSTFVILLLAENHYQKGVGRKKLDYIAEWNENAEYYAFCEGDDYWIDPQKLQGQVHILDTYSNCMLVCCRTRRFSLTKKEYIEDNKCYPNSQWMDADTIILKGGLFVSTCSIIFRSVLTDNYPEYCKKCHVGDYPRIIMAAMRGQVYYINKPMAVYRVENPFSWVGRQRGRLLSDLYLNGVVSEVRMLQGFQRDYPYYWNSFQERINSYILQHAPNRIKDPVGYKKYNQALKDEIRRLSIKYKILLSLKTSMLARLYNYYYAIKKRLEK